MSRNKCFLLFLVLNLFWGYTAAAENKPFLPENLSELTNSAESDSVKTYYDLIAKENYDSHYGPNVAGMVVGGIFVSAGAFFSVGALHAASENDWTSAIAGGAMLTFSIPLYLVGIPVLLYNTYKFAVRKGHANRRDEYKEALKRYKLRQENSAQWTLLPSVNPANAGGGLNLFVAF